MTPYKVLLNGFVFAALLFWNEKRSTASQLC